MPLPINISLNGISAPIELRAGASTIIVGANGSGKTKLAKECERQLGAIAHRISAQRMLSLDPSVAKIGEQAARMQLRYGHHNPMDYGGEHQTREVRRWGQNSPGFILNDAGALLQVLFAEQANIAVKMYNAMEAGNSVDLENTFLRSLKSIFKKVLPTRPLEITADDILVTAVANGSISEPYSITEMSDGEKAVFYIIGQVLVADAGSVFIMDEPEIHVHRSILGRLWDELEASRPDCAFLLITHDLDFAAARAGKKYVVRSYLPASGWIIEDVPEAEGFSEEMVTLILGSRKPILFVEGNHVSLDLAFYRVCYPTWTVIPRGGCEGVIHSVVTLRHNAAFTRVECAGIVDADGHNAADRVNLASKGIQILPVSEIENLLLLPTVSRTILEMNDFSGLELEEKLAVLKTAILNDASVEKNVNEVVLGYCRRRIDRTLKQLDFSTHNSISELAANYAARTAELDVTALAAAIKAKISAAVAAGDLVALLAVYDRKKPLLALAAAHLRNWKIEVFSAWVTRAMQSTQDDRLRKIIGTVLPPVIA